MSPKYELEPQLFFKDKETVGIVKAKLSTIRDDPVIIDISELRTMFYSNIDNLRVKSLRVNVNFMIHNFRSSRFYYTV